MPEAEDVILEAAERATAAARTLWKRGRPASAPTRGLALDECERPLGFLLTACLGGQWPILASDPPAAAGWLARRLGNPPPWMIAHAVQGFTDGTQLFLPRQLELCSTDVGDREALRLLALSLGARIADGSVALCPVQPVARDLFWAADGARIDAWLAEELPGHRDPITRARRLALVTGPHFARSPLPSVPSRP